MTPAPRVVITEQHVTRILELKQTSVTDDITPKMVVDDARNPESPLHDLFDWDDAVAAERWRITQARVVLRRVSLVIVVQDLEVRTPMFVRNPDAPVHEQSYIEVKSLEHDPARARRVITMEFARMESALRRMRTLATALDLLDDVDQLLLQVIGVRKKFDGDTPEEPSVDAH